jgi:hypothetical protein
VTGPGSCRDWEGSAFCEETCFWVDAENADEVGTKVGYNDDGLCGVKNHFMGMRGFLTVGVSAWCGEVEHECL